MKQGKKIGIFISLITFLLILAACGATSAENKEIKIGYQKNGTTLMLKNNGELEKALEEEGYKISWSEFNTGSSTLEALNSGAVDFANAGDIPSIFTLANGDNLRYIATELSIPQSEGILVGKDSGIESIADLKGKKVAYNNASIAQYLLVQALETEGLTLDDVESTILTPPDASIAFEQGQVDAWVVWDPYLTISESNGNKLLIDATDVVAYRSLYFANKRIAEENPEIVDIFVEHVTKTGKEIDVNPDEAAELLYEETNIDAGVWVDILTKRTSDVHYIDEEVINDLQRQSEDLVEMGLIDEAVTIADFVWYPEDR